ncbi:hypothetical protein DH2020_046347 [Rehmannia glutinosa]|uniref:Poly [ADP-ribose] polymerase n=1 Tax=Rehmannia glutinosa TaxID=99300 RepID=A0ABR0UBJ1_REHGL
MVTRKQKAEAKLGSHRKRPSSRDEGRSRGSERPTSSAKSTEEIKAAFEKFCKATSEHLSIQQMREILEANGQDSTGSDDAVVPRCQDILFYGPLDKCYICGGTLEATDSTYKCSGTYSEWSSCIFTTRDPPRKDEPIKLPDSVMDSDVVDLLKEHQDVKSRPPRVLSSTDKPFKGMMISLAGRLTRTHQYWKSKIEKHGGKVSTLLLSLDSYDIVSDLAVDGKRFPYTSRMRVRRLSRPLQLSLRFWKEGVHKDTKLQNNGGEILEKDGLLYNCAFARSDRGRGVNEFCILQLITVPENRLYMYYKKGQIGDESGADETLDEWEDVNAAIKDFAKRFEELTGNEFEPWEREKKIEKKMLKFFPIDIDDGVEVRHGALGLRQLGVAVAHCKLDPKVRVDGDGIRFSGPPLGMITDIHLKRFLLEFTEKLKATKETGEKEGALWSDFSQRIFTLMPSTRPYVFRDFSDIADHGAAAFETVRDINVASRLIGDMSGATLDDPLFERYKKLGCSISTVEKDSDNFKMIAKYLEKTYEPVKVGEISYGVSIDDVFAVELSAGPSLDEIKRLPNKVLLWHSEFKSVAASGEGILACSVFSPRPWIHAEAARYGFTAVDRPEGFLVLAVASLGENVTELTSPPEDATSLEEKKKGVIALGRKRTDESEHFMWNGDIKVPCGELIPSEHKDSPLEYNEYAVYDPQQVSIRYLVAVKFEEKGVVYDTAE